MDPVQLGKTVRMDISALFYYKFVDQGVKGTKKGSGKYAFKNDGVGKKMMIAIRKWVIREGLKHKSDKYKAITKREAKRKSITDTSTSTAYAIAKSVKQKGIEPSGFFTDAVRSTQAAANEELGAALKIDIINTLPNGLNNKD